MSLHAQPATYDTVEQYLLAAYRVDQTEVDEALRSTDGGAKLYNGQLLGSFAGYVADEIARAPERNWVEREDFDPDEEDEDG